MRVNVNELFEELGGLSQVEAIALGGSRVTETMKNRTMMCMCI